MAIFGYILATIVGISLGLIGGGGSILTLPILVYIMGLNPVTATSYSLFIVGSTALTGGIKRAMERMVDIKTVFIFAAPSILIVYITRLWLLPAIPDEIMRIASFNITKSMATMMLFAL